MSASVFEISKLGQPTESSRPTPKNLTSKNANLKDLSVSLLENCGELQRAKRYYENAIFISTVLSQFATRTTLARVGTFGSAFTTLTPAEKISTLRKLSLTKYGRFEAMKIIKKYNKKSNSSRLRRFHKFHAKTLKLNSEVQNLNPFKLLIIND